MTFLGAVFAEKIVNLFLATSLAGKTPIRDLTSLFGEERFKRNLFEDLYERSEGRQGCWLGIEIVCLGLNYRGHVEETNNPLPEEPIYQRDTRKRVPGSPCELNSRFRTRAKAPRPGARQQRTPTPGVSTGVNAS
jgi:hypothetical protein